MEWLIVFFIIFIYLTPYMIADKRGHNNKMAITATNVFLGWTIIGWVIALIWALTDNVKEKQCIKN